MASAFRVGAWVIEPDLGTISGHGRTTRVEPKVMDVCVRLARNAGRVVSKEQLIQSVWEETFVGDDVLVRCISELRRAFDDNPRQPQVLETIPKRGYRLIPPVIMEPPEPIPSPDTTARGWSKWSRVAIAASLLLLTGLLAASVWRRSNAGPRPIEKIALVPLENLSAGSTEEYFSDGLTEALITALAQVEGLTVIARDSVMRYRGTAKTSEEIAGELDVDAVVRGSVIQSRDTVQIRAQLVDPRTGRLLWAKSYVRTSREVMTLLGEIAATVAGELNVQLTPELRTRLTRAQPVVPAANAAYLRGRHHWSKITAEGYRKSLDYFQEAIRLDGNYAPAYAGLARSYMALSQLQRPGDVVPKAREALDKALALDPSLAEAHTLRAQLKMRDMDWKDAEVLFQQALDLSPNDPLAHLHYAAFLNQSGRHEEALHSVRRAEEIDPLSPLISANVMLRLNSLGRYEETLKQAARARELQPDFWLTEQWAAGANWNLGRKQEAISAWEKALTLPGAYQAWLLSRLTEAYLDEGRRSDAERALSRLVDLAESQYVEPVVLARAYAAVGRRSEAVDVLEEGLRNRELDLWRLKGLERYLGENPRYRELRRAVGGPERSSAR